MFARGWSLGRLTGVAGVLLIGLGFISSGCEDATPEQSCVVATDCESGQYCNDDGTCVADCGAAADGATCGEGRACDERGQCVAQGCAADTECPEGHFCDGDVCAQECDPAGDGGECGGEEVCTSRGRCVTVGACTADEECTDIPEDECYEDTLVTHDDGQCVQDDEETACEYPLREEKCEFGCENGACEPNPCDEVFCDEPPETACGMNGETLVGYAEEGTCVLENGEPTCEYDAEEKSCAYGCEDAACNDGPCDAVTCDSPPEAKCEENVAVTYASNGTCREMEGEGTTCDYSITRQDCSYIGATCEDATCKDAVSQSGEVIIVEMMIDPKASRDYGSEWFEVVNPSAQTVDMKGWIIESGGGQTHEISESVEVEGGQRVVLANGPDPLGDGSVEPAYVYSAGVALNNGEDSLSLIESSDAGSNQVVDYTYWEPETIMPGRSRKFDSTSTATPGINDQPSKWCPSLNAAEQLANGDYGTPGTTNEPCAESPCDVFTCEEPRSYCDENGDGVRPTRETASCSASPFNNPICDWGVQTFDCTDQQLCVTGTCKDIPTSVPEAGEVVITEIMGNPSAVSDRDGEWIELLNTTSRELSLFTVMFDDSESGSTHDSFTFTNDMLTIPANGYLVVAVETDSAKNGGLTDAVHYQGSHLKNSPGAQMKLKLVRQDGTLIDEAPYHDPASGASQQLALAAKQGSDPASANDSDQNWCETSSATYGDGDNGSPGKDNENCSQ